MQTFLPTITNTITVALGASVGLLWSKHISERYRKMLFQSIGLLSLAIGFRDALTTGSLPVLAMSLILGGLLGESLRIEEGLDNLAGWLKRKLGREEDTGFVEGFVTSMLLFCVGTMTFLGCYNAAVHGDGELLYAKAIMDGSVAIFFAAAMGMGVLCSAVGVLCTQGVLTALFLLMAHSPFLSSLDSESVRTEISAVGGTIIVGIGINLLGLTHVKVANLIPAMFVAGLLAYLFLA